MHRPMLFGIAPDGRIMSAETGQEAKDADRLGVFKALHALAEVLVKAGAGRQGGPCGATVVLADDDFDRLEKAMTEADDFSATLFDGQSCDGSKHPKRMTMVAGIVICGSGRLS